MFTWAVCPRCECAVEGHTPKPHGYRMPTKPCFECQSPLCEGSCRDTAVQCSSPDCNSLICSSCVDGRIPEDVLCSFCLSKLNRPERISHAA